MKEGSNGTGNVQSNFCGLTAPPCFRRFGNAGLVIYSSGDGFRVKNKLWFQNSCRRGFIREFVGDVETAWRKQRIAATLSRSNRRWTVIATGRRADEMESLRRFGKIRAMARNKLWNPAGERWSKVACLYHMQLSSGGHDRSRFASQATARYAGAVSGDGLPLPETYEFRDRLAREWQLNLVNVVPRRKTVCNRKANLAFCTASEPTKCCQLRKVEPLLEALEPFEIWFTGLRREQSPTRKNLKKVEEHRLPSWNKSL